jgi:uroporphyrinogen decarboxylase
MTSKELVSAALTGQPIPRVPTGPLAVHFCAPAAGYTIQQYTTDARILSECVIRYYERFKPDAVWVSADTWVSAEAMGAQVGATDPNQPFGGMGQPLIQSARDIARIPAPDVGKQGRYPLMLEALERIRAVLGDEVFIVACFDQYPFSLAAALLGINEIMVKIVDDPPLVEALMNRCSEYAAAYGRALSEAGADMLSGGDSPAGLIGPELYKKLALPQQQRVIAMLKSATTRPVSLHICGKALPILQLMKASGADVLEIDHNVDLAEACRVVGPETGLWGNLDTVGLLVQGTPEQIRRRAKQELNAARAAGHTRFVLSSGCTLAVETPSSNLRSLIGWQGTASPTLRRSPTQE